MLECVPLDDLNEAGWATTALSEPRNGSGFRLLGLDGAVLRRGDGDKVVEQVTGQMGDFLDSLVERLGVRLGRLGASADLAHVLQSGGVHLIVVRGGPRGYALTT